MNDIFYHITSASLSWNPFIHFLHTLHSIPSPDIVTGWHILCLIYFLYNTSLNQTRTEISTFLMSLHQAPLSSPPQRVHQALSLARGPGTLPPSPLWGSWHLCAEGPLHPRQHFLKSSEAGRVIWHGRKGHRGMGFFGQVGFLSWPTDVNNATVPPSGPWGWCTRLWNWKSFI